MIHKHFRGHGIAVMITVTAFLATLLTAIMPPITASAATSCTWTSHTTVSCNGTDFSESQISGNNMTLIKDNCNTLTINNYKSTKPSGTIYTGSFNTHTSVCQGGSDSAQLTNSWADVTGNPNSTCPGIDAKGVNCAKIPMGCPGSSVQGPVSPNATLNCPYPPSSGSNWTCQAKTCNFPNGVTVSKGKKYQACPSGATQNSDGTCTCSDGSNVKANGKCPPPSNTSCGGGNFDWVICPSDSLFQTLAQKLMEFMQSLLYINTNGTGGIFTASGNGTAYYRAWNSFRILGTAVIVIAGLVMVSAQAFGFEFLDAYTIRKVLPRLFVAIIGMSLSWPLLNFVIDFFNTVGQDIQQLMYAPFQSLPNHAQLADGVISWGFIATIAGLLAAGYGTVLLPVLGTGALALLIAVLILIVRQIGVTLLVILAPFAIAAYVLPNTKKIWDVWKDNFLGLMLMYPIIMMLIAAGEIFGAVGKSGSFVQQIVGIVAFFIPYFMIPLAFRMASGFISQVSGMVNDRSKGAFDRMRNARGNIAKKRTAALRSGNRFAGGNENNWRGKLNRGFEVGGNINKAGWNPRRMRGRMRTALGDHAHDEATTFGKESAAFNAFSGDDAKLWAAKATDAAEIGAILADKDKARFGGPENARARQDAIDQIQRAQRETSAETFQRARVRAQAATGTGYANAGEMLQDINDAYGNDRGGAGRALAEMRSAAMQSGRVDLGAAGFGVMSGQMEALNNGPTAQHYRQVGVAPGAQPTDAQKKQARALQAQEATAAVMDNVIDSAAPGQAIYGKRQSAEQLAKAHARKIQKLSNEVTTAATPNERAQKVVEFKQAMASAAGVYDAMNNASPQNAREFANGLMSDNFNMTTMPPEVRTAMANVGGGAYSTQGSMSMLEAMENMRMNDPHFAQMRHDFRSQAAQQAASYAPNPGAGGPPPGAPPAGPPGGP